MRRVDPRNITKEHELDNTLTEYCKLVNLLHYHTHDSRRSNPGFPDWTIVYGSIIVFVEMKSDTGRLTSDQGKWINTLRQMNPDGVKAWIVRGNARLSVLIDYLSNVAPDPEKKLNQMTTVELGKLNARELKKQQSRGSSSR